MVVAGSCEVSTIADRSVTAFYFLENDIDNVGICIIVRMIHNVSVKHFTPSETNGQLVSQRLQTRTQFLTFFSFLHSPIKVQNFKVWLTIGRRAMDNNCLPLDDGLEIKSLIGKCVAIVIHSSIMLFSFLILAIFKNKAYC